MNISSKKIGIVSLVYGSNNYGGILQGYALAKACQKLGYDAKQISIEFSKTTEQLKNSKEKDLFTRFIKKKTGLKKRFSKYVYYHLLDGNKRGSKFNSFYEYNIPHTEKVYSISNINETNELFDSFICGSDVIWQQNNPGMIKDIYYLGFVENEKRKIAYAPSFGKNFIPKENYSRTRELLSRFDALSVREESGKKILAELGLDSKLVLDPTLLISKDDWLQLCSHGDYFEKKQHYAFAYLLGEIPQNRKSITSYCKKANLKLITIPYGINRFRSMDFSFGDQQILNADPIAFLNLIRNADIFFTDSFHGIVFSSIFNVKYWAFPRNKSQHVNSLNTRLENIVELLGTKDRYIKADDLYSKNDESINWSQVNRNMATAINNSKEYLKNALSE